MIWERLSGVAVSGLSAASYGASSLGAVLAIGILVHERLRMRGTDADTSAADLVLTARS